MTMAVETQVAVKCWDHSAVPVMDLVRAERFYTQTLGGAMFRKVGLTFDAGTGKNRPSAIGTFVKLGRQHLGLFLQPRTPVYPAEVLPAAAPCWALTVAAADFDALIERVRASGVPLLDEQSEPFGARDLRTVRCLDSEGNGLELVADEGGPVDGCSVTGLSHLHLEALDLAATAAFYGQFLGATVVEQTADRLALAVGDGQHLVFHRVARLAPASVGPYAGRHFAYHVDHDQFQAIVDRLHAAGVDEGDHPHDRVPGDRQTYFDDPSGYMLQLTTESSGTAVERGGYTLRYVTV
jgi:catechol 2,3-dioxygenase-like lactoylglutathione lyase family enzyme